MLKEYFRSPDVPNELAEHKSLFEGLAELSENRSRTSFGEEMINNILEEEYRESVRKRWIRRTVLSVAASVIILFGAFFLLRPQPSFDDTFDDPEIAYAYAEETIEYMAGKYQKGMAQLSGVKKITSATSVYNENIRKASSGFSAINKLNKYQQLIKIN